MARKAAVIMREQAGSGRGCETSKYHSDSRTIQTSKASQTAGEKTGFTVEAARVVMGSAPHTSVNMSSVQRYVGKDVATNPTLRTAAEAASRKKDGN